MNKRKTKNLRELEERGCLRTISKRTEGACFRERVEPPFATPNGRDEGIGQVLMVEDDQQLGYSGMRIDW
jgi:hypothetical protein